MKTINIIVAVQKSNNGIGIGNDLLYEIKEDMDYFKKITHGSIVIMGRKTWESIPAKFRPLPNRVNMVISKTMPTSSETNVKIYTSLEAALKEAKEKYPYLGIFVIGGSSIYQTALPYSDFLYATEIEGERKAEIFFPDYSNWIDVEISETHISKSGIKYEFAVYKNPAKISLQ